VGPASRNEDVLVAYMDALGTNNTAVQQGLLYNLSAADLAQGWKTLRSRDPRGASTLLPIFWDDPLMTIDGFVLTEHPLLTYAAGRANMKVSDVRRHAPSLRRPIHLKRARPTGAVGCHAESCRGIEKLAEEECCMGGIARLQRAMVGTNSLDTIFTQYQAVSIGRVDIPVQPGVSDELGVPSRRQYYPNRVRDWVDANFAAFPQMPVETIVTRVRPGTSLTCVPTEVPRGATCHLAVRRHTKLRQWGMRDGNEAMKCNILHITV
jgi:hypothetical protein